MSQKSSAGAKPATNSGKAREALLAEVATLYHADRFTQEEIARQIGRSVATVSRLLARAEATNIIEFHVRNPAPLAPELQRALVERFGLRVARVARATPAAPRLLAPQAFSLAARYVLTLLADGAVITVSGGTAARGVISAMTSAHFHDLHIVQGVGSFGSKLPDVDHPLLTQTLADRIGGTPHYLPGPMIVGSADVRDALERDPHFQETLALYARSDIALVGIGGTDPERSVLCRAGYLDAWAMERIRASGAVGDIMVEFFDRDGQILETEISSRVVGMRQAGLRQARAVVAVAGGAPKVPAILGALRTGLIHVLVTDEATARGVLDLADANASTPLAINSTPAAIPDPSPPVDNDDATRAAILAATRRHLARDGYQRLSLAAVAETAAVAEDAIFRRWPTKATLVGETVRAMLPDPPRGMSSLLADLEWILSPFLADGLGREEETHLALRTMVAEAQLDPELYRVYRGAHERVREPLVAAIERGKARGEAPPDADAETLAGMILGAVWYRLLLMHEPPSAALLRELLAIVSGASPAAGMTAPRS